MKSWMLWTLVTLGAATLTLGDVYYDRLLVSHTGTGPRYYCQTREVVPTVIPYGETRDTDNCYRCTCDHLGLTCVGFGIKQGQNAQQVNTPPGCILVIHQCRYYFIDQRTGNLCPE